MAASVKQLPAALTLECVAGNPFALTVTATGATTVASPVVTVMTSTGDAYTSNAPTVSQAGLVTTVSWSAVQTAAMNTTTRPMTYRWSLRATVNGSGPFELVAKTITVHPVGSSASGSTSTAATLAITVGGAAVSLAVTI